MTSLEAVETVLSERASGLGVEIRRGVTVSAVAQDDESVVVQAGEHEYAARWLVGCDGGRSTVRGLAGFEFVGTEPQFTGYVVLAAIADPEKLRPGFNLTPTGMYLRTPAKGHIGMMDFDGGAFDRSQPPTREHLQAVLRRVSGTDVTLSEVHLASSFTDRAMQATTYRQGRVLLAGDAAHIHSPLGGTGTQPRPRRRHEPGMEARGDRARPRAGRAARHLHPRAPSDRRGGARLVARAGRGHEAGPACPGGPRRDARPARDPRRNDLRVQEDIRVVEPLRPRQRAPARRPQRPGPPS